MAWSLQTIMHLGRWASAAVMAYVEEALSELAPGAPRKMVETVEDWASPLPALSARVSAVEEKLEALRKKVPRLLPAARKAEVVTQEVTVVAPPPDRRWVEATAGGKLHREVSGCAALPAYCWKTGCGWYFGSSTGYDFATDVRAQNWTGPRCAGGCDLSEAYPH